MATGTSGCCVKASAQKPRAIYSNHKSLISMKTVNIIMYRWAGSKFGFTIKNECEECEINTGILEDIKQNEFLGKPVKIAIKPWLTFIWESLWYGGWHAPVVVVNGKLFSQGVVIDRVTLVQLVFEILNE